MWDLCGATSLKKPSSGFVIKLITFCPIPFLILLDLS